MDAVEQAKSGHPGLPMGAAPMAYALWQNHLIHNPKNPHWFNRDRFVLSIGHASPEAAAGGAIGLVRDGDKVLIDIPQRSINLLVSDEELSHRRIEQDKLGWKPAQPRARRVTTALKAYALLATSADKGGVRDKALLG